MDKIRWGIIGCGDVTERKSGPAFYKLDNSALAAVMRRNGALARDYALRHGALAAAHSPGHGVPRWYDDAAALIHDPQVDAVYVATPPSGHCPYTLEALQAGKPVYVEKPMALDYAQCRHMIDCSRRTGVPLFVAYYRRSLPYFEKVRELLLGGAIGTPLDVRLAFSCPPRPEDLDRDNPPWRLRKEIAGGGYLLDMGSHQINLLQWLFGGGEVVSAYTANRAGLYEVEDYVSADLRFDGGLTAHCVWNFAAPEDERADLIEVAGSKGVMRFSAFEMASIEVAGAETARYEVPAPEHIQMPHIGRINRVLVDGGFDYGETEEAAATTLLMERILAGGGR